jgi:hypothetical protein
LSDGKDEAQADIDGRLLEVYERLLRLSPEKSRAYKDILDKKALVRATEDYGG